MNNDNLAPDLPHNAALRFVEEVEEPESPTAHLARTGIPADLAPTPAPAAAPAEPGPRFFATILLESRERFEMRLFDYLAAQERRCSVAELAAIGNSFTCPRCGSHEWGTDSEDEVLCHGYVNGQPCGFTGKRADHIKEPPLPRLP